MPPRQIVQRSAKVVVQAIVWSGIAGIIFNCAMIIGLFGSLHWVNYGPGEDGNRVEIKGPIGVWGSDCGQSVAQTFGPASMRPAISFI